MSIMKTKRRNFDRDNTNQMLLYPGNNTSFNAIRKETLNTTRLSLSILIAWLLYDALDNTTD